MSVRVPMSTTVGDINVKAKKKITEKREKWRHKEANEKKTSCKKKRVNATRKRKNRNNPNKKTSHNTQMLIIKHVTQSSSCLIHYNDLEPLNEPFLNCKLKPHEFSGHQSKRWSAQGWGAKFRHRYGNGDSRLLRKWRQMVPTRFPRAALSWTSSTHRTHIFTPGRH